MKKRNKFILLLCSFIALGTCNNFKTTEKQIERNKECAIAKPIKPTLPDLQTISLNKPNSLLIGESTYITYSYSPSNANVGLLSWTSSDTGIATINSSGLLTGISAGTVNITCSSLKYNLSSTISIIINDAYLNSEEVLLKDDETYTLEIYDSEDNKLNNITYTSLNEDIATIDEDGIITPVSDGVAIINAKVNEKLMKQSKIYVINEVEFSLDVLENLDYDDNITTYKSIDNSYLNNYIAGTLSATANIETNRITTHLIDNTLNYSLTGSIDDQTILDYRVYSLEESTSLNTLDRNISKILYNPCDVRYTFCGGMTGTTSGGGGGFIAYAFISWIACLIVQSLASPEDAENINDMLPDNLKDLIKGTGYSLRFILGILITFFGFKIIKDNNNDIRRRCYLGRSPYYYEILNGLCDPNGTCFYSRFYDALCKYFSKNGTSTYPGEHFLWVCNYVFLEYVINMHYHLILTTSPEETINYNINTKGYTSFNEYTMYMRELTVIQNHGLFWQKCVSISWLSKYWEVIGNELVKA